MLVRGILRAANRPALRRPYPDSSSVLGQHRLRWPVRTSIEFSRGAKRKAIVQIDSLPQGQLPPLEPVPSNVPTHKGYPPTIQGHFDNVRKFKGCVVLTRVGDFYELYGDQVDQYAHQLNLKKATRATSLGPVAMAGFQHTALERYLKTLVLDLGQKVAISDQIKLSEDERQGSNLYERRVTRVVTAGTLIDETFVDPYENNYLLAVYVDTDVASALQTGAPGDDFLLGITRKAKVGLSWLDLSSGEFNIQFGDLTSLPSLVARVRPREVVLDSSVEKTGFSTLQKLLGEGQFAVHFHQNTNSFDDTGSWSSMLEKPLPLSTEQVFSAYEKFAANLVLDYVRDKMVGHKIQLQTPIRRSNDEFMGIDKQSLRGLEIRSTLRDGAISGSLLHAMRQTVTKSGARLLADRLVSPSMLLAVINDRLDLVQELSLYDALREDIIALLLKTTDTTRLMQRFSIGRGDADDLLGLARTIHVMVETASLLKDHIHKRKASISTTSPELESLERVSEKFELEGPTKVANAIQSAIDEEGLSKRHAVEGDEQALVEEMAEEVVAADAAGKKSPRLVQKAAKAKAAANGAAPFGAEDIWIMRSDTSPTLARAHSDLAKLLQAATDLESRLRVETKAPSLSLKWTAQLGHHCHIKTASGSRKIDLPKDARVVTNRKTSYTFILTEWSQLGTKIDDSKLRIRAEEDRVFNKLRFEVIENIVRLRRNASLLDQLDVACSSAKIATSRNLVRPILDNSTAHHIINGRHPTVDIGLTNQGRTFTANDCTVGESSSRIYLITGPNMAGKSTYLRQNALITILAQTGLFVPADYARIGLVDRIFSRVGSGDNLYQDQSTFMVEMLETSEILTQATPRSFVVMDEVGRGTTPEDGLAVGYACLKHLHDVNKSRTLFATHFHGLAELTAGLEGVERFCTDVGVGDGEWWYDHRVRRGVNRESHALKVARRAGMPEWAVEVAEGVLRGLKEKDGEVGEAEDESKAAGSA